jgi:hypothetical protein
LTIYPSSLSWLAAREEIHLQEHPCQRLAAERARLELARDVDHVGLIEARKHRMVPAAQDCLGLPSEEAAVAAVDRLVARSAVVAAHTSGEGQPMASAEAASTAPTSAATSGVGGPDAARATAPGDASEASEAASDALADLLAALRQPASPSTDTGAGVEPAAATQEATTVEPEPPAGSAAVATAPAAPEDPEISETPDAPESGTYTVTAGLNYRTRPSTDAPRLGIFGPGAQVRVTGFEDGWAEIELSDGRRVFAFGEFLEPVP